MNRARESGEQKRIYLGRFGARVDGYALGALLARQLALLSKLGVEPIVDCHEVVSLGEHFCRGLRSELVAQVAALGIDDLRYVLDRASPGVLGCLLETLGTYETGQDARGERRVSVLRPECDISWAFRALSKAQSEWYAKMDRAAESEGGAVKRCDVSAEPSPEAISVPLGPTL